MALPRSQFTSKLAHVIGGLDDHFDYLDTIAFEKGIQALQDLLDQAEEAFNENDDEADSDDDEA